jgi:hypothetical protein
MIFGIVLVQALLKLHCHDAATVRRQPHVLTYNQYLVSLHPVAWQANLLSLQAFVMTQVRCVREQAWVRNRVHVWPSHAPKLAAAELASDHFLFAVTAIVPE